ncbi:MAG: hypothetical protein A2293_06845 [Elusimicrobia bacterium RIFOXYB2_FULL_49_7]|nr:MAG: hypothetical protein A2293_06845 [Elusimicrobia bacterium RIFOXYB2_FULL_49_7]
MKICIWYSLTDGPWGGSNNFLGSLSGELLRQGHDVVHVPAPDCDAVLVNSFTCGFDSKLSPGMVFEVRQNGISSWKGKAIPSPVLKIFFNKRKGPAIVHRCDGVTALYGRHDNSDKLQFAINSFTDRTVFQSEFSKKSFARFGIAPVHSSTIFNGVDTSLFYPGREAGGLDGALRAVAVSWSSNPKKGFSYLSSLAQVKGIKLTFIGNWCKDYPAENIKIIQPLKKDEMARALREQNVFVHAAQNDPCSNALIEGLASGLPVIYHPSGGNAELAGAYGVPVGEDVREDVENIRVNYALLREKLVAERDMFSISRKAKEYLEAFSVAREAGLR